MKRKLLFFLVFILSFLLFLYLMFPFEKLIEGRLSQSGVSFRSVEVSRFPLKVRVEKLSYRGFLMDELVVSPSLLSLFSGRKRFDADARLCGGKVMAGFDYPLHSVEFLIRSVDLSSCLSNLGGIVSGRGSFSFLKANVKGGKAHFDLKSLKVKKFSFGLLDLKDADVGSGDLAISVKGRNLLGITLKTSGKDVKLSSEGVIRLNPKDIYRSYVNLKVSARVFLKPFNGKRFNFNVRGKVKELVGRS